MNHGKSFQNWVRPPVAELSVDGICFIQIEDCEGVAHFFLDCSTSGTILTNCKNLKFKIVVFSPTDGGHLSSFSAIQDPQVLLL